MSVIIPAFNAAEWIRESVGSILTQTFSHLEIIIVDDGSSDETALIVAEFTDPRIHLIRQAQRGAAAARNAGMAIATGEFIQFLDADDLLSAEKIHRQLEALRDAEPDSIASCEWLHFSASGSRKPIERAAWHVRDPIDWLVKSLRGGGMMQPAAWLTPRDVIRRAGPWNEALTLHDDGDFFARVLAKCRSNIFVDNAVVMYRDNPRGLSRQRSRTAVESALAVCRSRHSVIIAHRSDRDALAAIATQYAQFAYEFGSFAPDLASAALDEIMTLKAEPDAIVGGRLFRTVMKIAGFPAAMRLRGIIPQRVS